MRYKTATLLPAISLFFLPAAIAMAQTSTVAQENFSQADVNDDGVLIYTEFATFIDLNAAAGLGHAARISDRGLHARAFQRVDLNGDGAVTTFELQALQ